MSPHSTSRSSNSDRFINLVAGSRPRSGFRSCLHYSTRLTESGSIQTTCNEIHSNCPRSIAICVLGPSRGLWESSGSETLPRSVVHFASRRRSYLSELQVISLEVSFLKSLLPHLYQFRFQLLELNIFVMPGESCNGMSYQFGHDVGCNSHL